MTVQSGNKELPNTFSIIEKLPAISIDHLGLSEEGLPHLLKLVHKGVRRLDLAG